MIYCSAEVEENEVLDQLSTGDLLEELESRGKQTHSQGDPTLSPRYAIYSLVEVGVPEEMLSPIREWASRPAPDSGSLKYWRMWAGVKE